MPWADRVPTPRAAHLNLQRRVALLDYIPHLFTLHIGTDPARAPAIRVLDFLRHLVV